MSDSEIDATPFKDLRRELVKYITTNPSKVPGQNILMVVYWILANVAPSFGTEHAYVALLLLPEELFAPTLEMVQRIATLADPKINKIFDLLILQKDLSHIVRTPQELRSIAARVAECDSTPAVKERLSRFRDTLEMDAS